MRKLLTHKRKPAVLGICVPLGSPSKKTVHVGLRCGCRAGRNFQRKSLELCYPTDRYKCTSSAHALHGSLVRHSWCQSVLIIPLDQAIHPLVRCKNRPQGGDFQRQSLKLRYQTDRYKCASSTHALYGSLTRHPSCESVLIIPLDQAIDSPVR